MPLTTPASNPAPNAATTAKTRPCGSTTSPNVTPHSAAAEPIDKSKLPEISSNVDGAARMPSTLTDNKMLRRLLPVRKNSDPQVNHATRMTRNTNRPASWGMAPSRRDHVPRRVGSVTGYDAG